MHNLNDFLSVSEDFSCVAVRDGLFTKAVAGVMARKFKNDGDLDRKTTWHIVLKDFFGSAVLLPIYSRAENLNALISDIDDYLKSYLGVIGDLDVFSSHLAESCAVILKKTQCLDTGCNELKKTIHHGSVIAGTLLFLSDTNAVVDEDIRVVFTTLNFKTTQ
ncbi:hypothetical protein [Photobacterium damselae]|uniref:hypothetical protein n=1 Tax=Photobacterium damselae TaxID=38293 RepID=UPI0040692367